MYRLFYVKNLHGKKSISKQMISLKEEWAPVWETAGVSGFTWVIDGQQQTFNHKSLDLHRLPFVDYNPPEPYSLIMSMVRCFFGLSFGFLQYLLITVGMHHWGGTVHAPKTAQKYYHSRRSQHICTPGAFPYPPYCCKAGSG